MAQEIAQVTGQPNVQTQEEIMKVTKDLLIDLSKKIKKLYNKLIATGAFIGRHVEEGYWGTFDKIEEAEKSVKEALVELNGILIELGVTPEEVVEEEEVNEGQVPEVIYNIVINELASIMHYSDMLVEFTLKHKVNDAYGVDNVRRALWRALLSLVGAIYYSC
jgi:hypothetical protein